MRWAYGIGITGIAATFIAGFWVDIDYGLAADISLVYVAGLTTIFVLMYGLRSNWRANRVGKIFFVKGVVLPLLLWQVVTSVWWGSEYPGRQHIRFAIYSLAAVAYLAMVVALWHEQRRDRRSKDELLDVEP
ncbi:hypothetical protein NIIDNTM18_42000 [Mycolicibacterium litorale]|uniref:Uncharacterized protein n=1 Tax=Mycolicibacterium litorale TaxID=758802 RepID=A0A6S6P9X6_9MYCO|nr:hypothetical protein [Mycolicibacterium litorale]BCI54922.1 hypothetical protein NIIDNTM18_42000 [Mycolicibacterium litorale]